MLYGFAHKRTLEHFIRVLVHGEVFHQCSGCMVKHFLSVMVHGSLDCIQRYCAMGSLFQCSILGAYEYAAEYHSGYAGALLGALIMDGTGVCNILWSTLGVTSFIISTVASEVFVLGRLPTVRTNEVF